MRTKERKKEKVADTNWQELIKLIVEPRSKQEMNRVTKQRL